MWFTNTFILFYGATDYNWSTANLCVIEVPNLLGLIPASQEKKSHLKSRCISTLFNQMNSKCPKLYLRLPSPPHASDSGDHVGQFVTRSSMIKFVQYSIKMKTQEHSQTFKNIKLIISTSVVSATHITKIFKKRKQTNCGGSIMENMLCIQDTQVQSSALHENQWEWPQTPSWE